MISYAFVFDLLVSAFVCVFSLCVLRVWFDVLGFTSVCVRVCLCSCLSVLSRLVLICMIVILCAFAYDLSGYGGSSRQG